MNLLLRIRQNARGCISRVQKCVKKYKETHPDLNNNLIQEAVNEELNPDEILDPTPLETVEIEECELVIYPHFQRSKDLFFNVTKDEATAIKWLQVNGFMAGKNIECGKCKEMGKKTQLKYYKLGKDTTQRKKGGLFLQCSGKEPRHRISPFNGTFFDGKYCKIPCSKVLELVYHFVWKMPVYKAAREVDVCPNTAIDYYNYLREVCTISTHRRGDNIIGGEGLTVEIDESKFFCRKYKRGRMLANEKPGEGSQQRGWVFGGICRETREVFMVRVPDRTRVTLYGYIKKHIREGTNIISDEWRAYATLDQEGYTHQTICHKRNFVSPTDPLVHTQNIESQWKQAKLNFPRNSTSQEMQESYLQEYLYRKLHGKENMIYHILADIKKLYPFKG